MERRSREEGMEGREPAGPAGPGRPAPGPGPPCRDLAEMKDRDNVTWYLKTSQLALALAIIRSKPPDKSSKEYAEHLAKIISRQDSKWKLRAEVLEAEVLHLRQQLLLSTFFPGLSGENRTPDAVGKALLPSNTEDYSGHFEDSGCDVSSDYIAGVPETVPTFNFRECGCSSSISDVSSSLLPLLTSSCVSKRDSVVSHMQFLQHFLELKKLSEAGRLRTDFKKLGNDCSTITDSFSQLLDGLVTSYSLSELPFSDVMHQAVCVITKLLSDADVSSQILGKCFKKLEDSMKRLVAVVMNSSNLNRFQMQDSISHALVLLGGCSILRNFTISLLFREVSQFADELQHANEIQGKYHIQYENIFFLCRVLEQLLETGLEEENAASSGCEEEQKQFLQKLDQAILHLSDEFPLFCIYLWRLGTLLNKSQIETCERNWPPK